MLKQSKGIVLSTLRYNDNFIIADVFTQTDGKLSFMVRTPRRGRSRATMRLFQPLVPVELSWMSHAGASLLRLRSAQPDGVVLSVLSEPHKTAVALFLAEFLRHALAQQPADDALYAYVSTSVRWLDACEGSSIANFHLVFLLRLARFLGFYPNLDGFAPGCCFDLLAARFAPTPPLHGHYLPPTDAARLPLLMRMRFETMGRFRFSRDERERLLSFINEYYRLHLPGFPELRSLDVLRQVFG